MTTPPPTSTRTPEPPQRNDTSAMQGARPLAPTEMLRDRRDALFAQILADWQAEIQFAVEAGAAPALGVGSTDSLPAAMVGIDAARRLADERRDMTSPVLTVGGSSGAWPAILLQPLEGHYAPSLNILFAGVDEGTRIATAGTLPMAPARLSPPGNRSLPNGYRPLVSPSLQIASPLNWESLPFTALEPPEPSTSAGPMPSGTLAGWLALIFVALLILGALAY